MFVPGNPRWTSPAAALVVVVLTACHLGIALRYVAEMSLLPQPALSFNWLPVYCFGASLLLTPLVLSMINRIPELKKEVRRMLVFINCASFACVVLPWAVAMFRDSFNN